MILLELQNATFRRWSGTPANGFSLSNVAFALRPGEHWAVLGPGGSGKSLLLDALAGRVPPSAGRLCYADATVKNGVELLSRDYSFDWRVAGAARFYQQRFTSQSADDAPTVHDVLQGQIRPAGTIDPASAPLPPPLYAPDWLADVAAQLNITHLLDRRLTALSNGETRRTLLARALLKRPRVLLLDNPFSGLDVASRAQLHDVLNNVATNLPRGLRVALVMAVDERDVPACITHRLTLPAPERSKTNVALGEPTATLPAPEDVVNPNILNVAFDLAVQMRNVVVRYGEKTVLDDVNWTVRRGEKWALLGPNGSGKSTLLSLITADNPQAYANDITLFDRRRGTGESIWSIKQRIGHVSPELHLFFPRQTTVWDVVASGLFDTMGRFQKLTPEQSVQVETQLAELGLTTLRDRPLSALSAGEQRWALLGRAFVKQPPLLILDEPTQGLDASHVAAFRQLIDERCARHPAQTLIYVTHYSDEQPRAITHTLHLADGRVAT